jgi:hypothetical protein
MTGQNHIRSSLYKLIFSYAYSYIRVSVSTASFLRDSVSLPDPYYSILAVFLRINLCVCEIESSASGQDLMVVFVNTVINFKILLKGGFVDWLRNYWSFKDCAP